MKHARTIVAAVTALVLVACGGRDEPGPADGSGAPKAHADSGAWLEAPFPLAPFAAVDLDGRDRSPSTWAGRVVVLNVWATWCAPCRREMPALAALQASYPDRLLVIGVLQDTVTTDFARAFVKSLRITYPIVRSTFEIESRFPPVLRLPMTFLIDTAGRLVAVRLGEVDAATLERDVQRVLPASPTPGGRIPSNTP